MNEMQLYELWKNQKMEDPDLAEELRQIEGDTDAIVDRFYKEMEFGTAGMRGVLGAGNNRMNIYTVRGPPRVSPTTCGRSTKSRRSPSATTRASRATSLPKRRRW